MIEAKGTRSKSADPDAPRQRYVLKDPPKSPRWPIAFGLFLVGLATYLKSVFPTAGDRQAETSHQHSEDQGQPPLELAAVGGGSPVDAPTGLGPGPEPEDAPGPRSARGGAPSIPSFMASDSPPIDFADMRRGNGFRDDGVRPSVFSQQAGNDNAAPMVGGSSGAPSGGSGGAAPGGNGDGGGEDSDPPSGDDSGTDGNEQPPCETDCADDCDDAGHRNRPPMVKASVNLPDISGCHPVFIAFSALLAGASDPDGDALSLAGLSVSSGVRVPVEGGWLYTPDEGARGTVTFSYDITDGALSVPQQAFLEIVEAPSITGTAGDDMLLGSTCGDTTDGRDGSDNIDGRGGDDVIAGASGDDHIVGGPGHDVLFAGDGHDVVFGAAGDDIIFGGRGNDRLFGGDGNDAVSGEAGDDVLVGGPGSDRLLGGDGNDAMFGDAGDDLILGGAGSDRVTGGAGDDVVHGDSGNDSIEGGDGDDRLSGGDGADLVFGGAGDDRILASSDNADDSYHGGPGVDTLDCSGTRQGVVFDLQAGVAVGADIGVDAITGFETFVGGEGDDTILADEMAGTFTGGGGDDSFVFSPLPRSGAGPSVIHEILDLMVGDRIVVGEYEIFQAENQQERDRFEQVYDSDGEEDRPFRFRHETMDGMECTVIDAIFVSSQFYGFEISVHGRHYLYASEAIE